VPKATNKVRQDDADDRSPAQRLRLRASWMYYVEEMTQQEIAQRLGVGRVTVVRMLAQARERNEVRIVIEDRLAECVALERQLEERYGLKEAIVAPLSSPDADATGPVSASAGAYLSDLVRSDMRIGVGWGRTLVNALAYMSEKPVENVSVVSMLGGIMKARAFNPAEFAWRFAALYQADCHLMTAPIVVDSPETRTTLIERCGLRDVFDMARTLDAVVLGAAGMGKDATAYRSQFISDSDRESLIAAGAVGDLLFNFLDAAGNIVEHPINGRVMSVPLSIVKEVPQRIIAAGGMTKVRALRASIKLLAPTTLITDQYAAAELLS
jgi:DNA-binding transcriptional regulator LsrR (DeoR family)